MAALSGEFDSLEANKVRKLVDLPLIVSLLATSTSLRENIKNMDPYKYKAHLGDKTDFLTSYDIRFNLPFASNNGSTIQ